MVVSYYCGENEIAYKALGNQCASQLAKAPRESEVLGTAMFAFHRRSTTRTKPICLHQVSNELLIATD